MAKLHLVGYPHTKLTGGYETCAYTQKINKFRKMNLDFKIITYGQAGSDIELFHDKEFDFFYGKERPNNLPSWPKEDEWSLFNQRAIVEIARYSEPGDLLLLAGGYSQLEIANALDLTVIEPFVGYEGILPESFCAFESNAWRHFIYGRYNIQNGRWMDRVIPNYFDPAEFHLMPKGDYLLYMGRIVNRKGVELAIQIAEKYGKDLVIAGPGGKVNEHFFEGEFITVKKTSNIHYVGAVEGYEKKKLLSEALALIAPTLYIEPFGGVAVEAMLSGTPVLTSDFGAFTETVENEVTGYRFRLFKDALDGLDRIIGMNPEHIRNVTASKYSIDAVSLQFNEWFWEILNAVRNGWYHSLRDSVYLTK